jgi:hypothetical protein
MHSRTVPPPNGSVTDLIFAAKTKTAAISGEPHLSRVFVASFCDK